MSACGLSPGLPLETYSFVSASCVNRGAQRSNKTSGQLFVAIHHDHRHRANTGFLFGTVPPVAVKDLAGAGALSPKTV